MSFLSFVIFSKQIGHYLGRTYSKERGSKDSRCVRLCICKRVSLGLISVLLRHILRFVFFPFSHLQLMPSWMMLV